MRSLIWISPVVGSGVSAVLFGLAYRLFTVPSVVQSPESKDPFLLVIMACVAAGLGVVGAFMAHAECKKHGE